MSTAVIPEPIAQLQRRLDQIRSTQRRGKKLPDSVWQTAVELAREHGVYSVAHPPGAQQACPIGRCGSFPVDAHLASAQGLELDDALFQRRCMWRDQFDEYRLSCLPSESGNSAQPFLQPHIVQP